jgi:hypothetical protein
MCVAVAVPPWRCHTGGTRIGKWLVPVLGGAVWAGSWYLMSLEVTRWHHVKPSLAFNSDVAPGARPGRPLVLLHAACVAGPSVVLAGVLRQMRGRHTRQ